MMNKYKVITMVRPTMEEREHIVQAHSAQDALVMIDFNHCQKTIHQEGGKRLQAEIIYKVLCVDNDEVTEGDEK